MAWTTPTIVEVCVGMEITAYEFGGNLSPTRKGPAARRAFHPFRADAKPNEPF